MMKLYISILLAGCAVVQAQYAIRTCKMMPNPSLEPTDPLYQPISGNVTFTQAMPNSTSIDIDIDLVGFNTTDGLMEHGFHVHQSGDISEGCEGALGHFNPFNKGHGAPSDTNRHVGDLGNIMEDAAGEVVEQKTDSVIMFNGTADITGRALVIHETFDDLGLGNFSDSNSTGHAGARLACCIITYTMSSARVPLVNYVMTLSLTSLLSVLALLRLE